MISKPIKELKHVSYSYLHAFACPYQAFLRYEAGMKGPITEHLALGNSLHKALEEGHKRPEWSLDFVSKLFLSEFRRIIDEDEVFVTWAKMRKHEADGAEMLVRYNHGIETGKILHPPFAVEKEFKLPFEDEIVVVGKIDRIDKEGEDYSVTDYKSGQREPTEWFLRHDLQFTAYAYAVQQLYGRIPRKLYWHHLRTGHLLETERTQEDINGLIKMMSNAIAMNKLDITYRVYNQQVCNFCDFQGAVCDDKELEADLMKQREELRAGVQQSSPVL